MKKHIKKPRVLIVEDERIIAFDLQTMVEELGYQVIASLDTASAAIAWLKGNDVDLIMLDIKLRGEETGIDAAREIRQFSSVPILFISGNTHLLTQACLKKIYPNAVIPKPPPKWELHAKIKTLLVKAA